MGLDNGILLLTKDELDMDFLKNHPNIKDFGWCENNYYEYEIAYWRKCYGVREIMLNVLSENRGAYNCAEQYDFELTYHELSMFIVKYSSILRKEKWGELDTIWSWEEIKEGLLNDFNSLLDIYHLARDEYLLDSDDNKIIFYDSY